MSGHVTRHLGTEQEVEVVVSGTRKLRPREVEIDRLLHQSEYHLKTYWDLSHRLWARYRYHPYKMRTWQVEKHIRSVIGQQYPMVSTRIWRVRLELSQTIPHEIWVQKLHELNALPAVREAGILELKPPPYVVVVLLEADTPRLLRRLETVLRW